MPPVVTLYTKPGCGLCEEAEEVIESVRARRPFELVKRNILDDLTDYEQFKYEIPVILVDGREVARHHLSERQLQSALGVAP
jgi:glutaredoxin